MDSPTSKKKAGRRKIKIEFIEDKSRRQITFSKRKAGLMKKVRNLIVARSLVDWWDLSTRKTESQIKCRKLIVIFFTSLFFFSSLALLRAVLDLKAYELTTLTGTQALLLVASETGHVYTFATPKLQPFVTLPEGKNLIQACLNAPDQAGPPSTQLPTESVYEDEKHGKSDSNNYNSMYPGESLQVPGTSEYPM
eukprot:TRINITY_DN2040_c0_g1_i2.p1 TRINITY_DN2040_c0_g1~~TRINITY_DN2040_c0_g1_i2.p1  ORF type:complete len:194 (-),score=23.29 TRINITY_DN2040_c0_g1_i2:129-710(-)